MLPIHPSTQIASTSRSNLPVYNNQVISTIIKQRLEYLEYLEVLATGKEIGTVLISSEQAYMEVEERYSSRLIRESRVDIKNEVIKFNNSCAFKRCFLRIGMPSKITNRQHIQ